jgi:cytochrome P450
MLTLLLVVILLVLVLLILYRRPIQANSVNNNISYAPKVPPSLPVFGSLEYFGGPYNFLKVNALKHGEIFSFSLLGQEVFYVGSTQDARDLFFRSENETLNFYEGYRELFGAIIGKELFGDHTKEISVLVNMQSLKKYFVDVIANTHVHLDTLWGKKGKVDLFHTAYNAVFSMTLRIIGCQELVEENYDTISKCYHILDSEFSSISLFAPWFPNMTQFKRYFARKKIFSILDEHIEKRINNPDAYDDNLSVIINYYNKRDGFVEKEHIKFVAMGVMFAAQTNTALAASWTLLYVISNPVYREKALEEIRLAMKKHDGKLTFEGLEEMKFLDLCINEALRLTISSGGWWRRVMYDIEFKGYHIPGGALMVNNPALYHLNEQYFKNAFTFDPYRKDPNPNIAFGIAKHPCLGKKMAILEVKTFIATALTCYDITTPTEPIPEVNRNTMHGSWPINLPFIEVLQVVPVKQNMEEQLK